MVNENHHRQVEDPIANYSGLSLFRSTFSLSSSKPYHDLDAIHEVLRSMDLGNSAKLVEQGKSVLECSSGFNMENSTKDVGDDDVFAAEEDEEFRRKNRGLGLGLNRVRPRFSLKETKKPSVEDLLPVLDFKNIKDPNEFFMAHERLENARKEIQKQLGIVPSESTLGSTKPRERRPGLPGFNRRPIKFRPSFSQETLDNNADALSSQEAFESDSLDPVGDNTEKGKASFVSLDNEVTDSSAVKEKKVNDILKGLLTLDSEELEGFGAMIRLQQRLQIKPVVFEKSSVPDFPDSQSMDLKSSHVNLSKPSKASSDISSLLKGIDIKTPRRQDVGYPEKQLASPTPPRSPFVLFSTLQKHISYSKPSKPSVDPFSAHEIDHESTKENSPTHMLNHEVNVVGSSKPSDELSAPIIEDVIAADETNKILDTSARPKEDNSRKLSEQLKASLTENEVAVSETFSVGVPTRNCISTPKKSRVANSREPCFNANVDSNEPPVDMDLDIGGSDVGKRVMDHTKGRQNVEPNEPDQFVDEMLAENMQETSDSIPTDDSNFNLVNPLADQSNPDTHEDIVNQSNPDAHEDIADQSNPDAYEDIADQSNPDAYEDIVDQSNPDAHEDIADQSNPDAYEDIADQSNPDAYEDIADQSNPDAYEDIADQSNPDAYEDIVDQSNPDAHEDIADQSNPDAHEDNSADNRSRRSDDGPEQCLQKKTVGNVTPDSGQKRIQTRAQKTPKGKRLRLPIGHEDNSVDNRSRRSDEVPEQCLQKKTVGSVTPDSGQKRIQTRAQKTPKGKRLRLPIGHEDNSVDNRSRRSDEVPEQCLQKKTVGSVAPDSGQNRIQTRAQKTPKGKRLRLPIGHEDNSADNRSRRSDDVPEQCLQKKTVGSVVPDSGQKRIITRAQKMPKGKRLRLTTGHEDNSVDNRSRRSDDVPEQCSQKKTVGSVAPDSAQKRIQTRAQKTPKGKRLRLPIGHEDKSVDNRSRRSDDVPEQRSQKKTVGSVAPDSGQKRIQTRAQKTPKGKRLRLPIGHEDNSVDNRSRRSDDVPEQYLQKKTVAPVSGQKRVKTYAQKEPKGIRLRSRKSLADAGTSWESGVRKSSRFKTRPLEFWKGERMVYGRVHESLTTVIGVKCLSPGADGKPIMKAKSFVSDKHKKLFELASRY